MFGLMTGKLSHFPSLIPNQKQVDRRACGLSFSIHADKLEETSFLRPQRHFRDL